MTTPIDIEFVMRAQLGAAITLYRPTALSESSQSPWQSMIEDTDFGLTTDDDYNLRLRLVAQDGAGNPITDPAWMVKAHTRLPNGSWVSLPDRDTSEAHFLTDHFAVDATTRLYRFTVSIPNSGISTTYEIEVTRHDANASDDHDVLYDPDDDFKPPPTPSTGNTPSDRFVAGDPTTPI